MKSYNIEILSRNELTEYNDLLNKLLELKPELTTDAIMDKIRIKKEKIGAGYLTDSGALFLIASEMGLDLATPQKIEMDLKDLYAGAKEITLEAKVLNISPAKQFSRKDGSPFHLRTMTVYDADATASVKMWDEKAMLPGIEDLKPGDLVRIIKAYVKSDLTGAPTINVGSGSSVEPADTQSTIPSIDSITKDVDELQEGQKNIVVRGVIEGRVFGMEFTNSRGQPGKALKMRLRGKSGVAMPVVLWGKDESDVPDMIEESAEARLLGIRVKNGNQGSEIHGDDATIIEIKGGEIKPVVVRILSISKTGEGRSMMLGTDSKSTIYSITDSSNMTGTCTEGDVVECMPSKVYGSSVALDGNSFVRKIDDDGTIPSLSKVTTKINQIKPDRTYCVEAIILKASERREIQTKSGELIALSEMLVGDDTGQIPVKGWRDQAGLLDECGLGDIVDITGVSAKAGFMGESELSLTAFSSIKKKNQSKDGSRD